MHGIKLTALLRILAWEEIIASTRHNAGKQCSESRIYCDIESPKSWWDHEKKKIVNGTESYNGCWARQGYRPLQENAEENEVVGCQLKKTKIK